jgi:threonine synthase
MASKFKCIRCGREYEPGSVFRCDCGGLLEVVHEPMRWDRHIVDSRLCPMGVPYSSGVWRFKELIHPGIAANMIVTRPEGNTNVYHRKSVSDFAGVAKLGMKHEGENPTGSFKDRGMTVAVSEAVRQGAKAVACASTGNTSASMAAYAAQAGLRGVVFIPEGEISYGKLSQAMAYGSKVVQVPGSFDDAMRIVQEASAELGLYLLNSINPWRVEGQKTIIFELLHQRGWESPDWIVVPAGNLGNTTAFGKALRELAEMGWIEKVPRIASIQAEGASPFYKMWKSGAASLESMKPDTVATAIKIGNPVSWEKAIRVIKETDGVVDYVSDAEIMEAKAVVDASGVGCEPASAASVAGVKKLAAKGVIKSDEDVVCILTGNLLKDSDATIGYHLGKLKGISAKSPNVPTRLEAGAVSASLRRILAQ